MRRSHSIFIIVWTVMIVSAFLFNWYVLCENSATIVRIDIVIIYSLFFLFGFFFFLYFRSLSKYYKLSLEAKDKALLDLNVAKDQFFSVIAHDLKTPAANIESLSQTLKVGFDDFNREEQKNCIDMLVESTKTHNDLVNTLLDLSRLRLGKKQYNPECLDVRKLVNQALEQTKLQAIHKQINQINQADECFVEADKNMITSVVRNLLVNAIKFTHSGGQIVIRTEKTDTEILVSIADTGIGIADEKKDHIFDVEHNKSTVGTANEAGTGLGLVLCKEYVERNGGRIWFESEDGKGTTFYFTLPVI